MNESGFRRACSIAQAARRRLQGLDVERCAGHLDDPAAVRSACAGADTLLHLAFKVSVGGGAPAVEEMQRINVEGTRTLLQAAAANGVQRADVTGSALAVGVNRQPAPLDESASWSEHGLDLAVRQTPATGRVGCARPGDAAVCGDDRLPLIYVRAGRRSGAPANKLLQALMAGKLPVRLTVGFGCLDVRDFAHGMELAGERGRSRQRYLLSGENVTADQLMEKVAQITGVRPPRFRAPAFLLNTIVGVVELLSKMRRQPPPITRDVLQIFGRYAWYDTSKSRTELGWAPRPLQETLTDTMGWLRGQQPQA